MSDFDFFKYDMKNSKILFENWSMRNILKKVR